MKLLQFLFFLALPGLVVKMNGEGDIVYEVCNATGFQGVSLAMDATVNYTQDTAFSLIIKGQQNILDKIETNVQNSRLTIGYEIMQRSGSMGRS
jgi:restriction endonuclease Mrr